jgi:hypothetical protein
MTWQGLVRYAARLVPSGSSRPEPDRSAKKDGSLGPAPSIEPKLRLNGSLTPDLTARAHRLHNRKAEAARRYLKTHEILAKGNCFDA